MARETLNIYRDLGLLGKVGGFIEQGHRYKNLTICSKKVNDSIIIDSLPANSTFIGAMGSPKRKKWIKELEKKKCKFGIVIHPSVLKGSSVEIGNGSIICQGVILTCDIKIGQHSIINVGSTISHDCIIGNFTTICPGVNIAGNVKINDECWIGIGTKIMDHVTIGKGSFISAGAVITGDIPEHVLAVGIPAKPIRKLKESDWARLV